MLKDYLFSINMSVYKLAKDSGVPYTTVLELTKNKTNVYKVSVGTAMAITKTLNISMDFFVNVCSEERCNFEQFRSSICHMLKEKGDKQFIKDLVMDDDIKHYFEYGWYEESLYLLALLDSLSEEYDIDKFEEYDDLRELKLDKTLYPADAIVTDEINKNDECKKRCLKQAMKEFLKYNIVECDFRDAI